jgi:hypothetical protein
MAGVACEAGHWGRCLWVYLMHSLIIAGSFLAMVFAPAIVATCSKFFPMRVKVRIVGPKAEAMPDDPVVRTLREPSRVTAVPTQRPH